MNSNSFEVTYNYRPVEIIYNSYVLDNTVVLPFGNFGVNFVLKDQSINLPLTIEITENPYPEINVGNVSLGGKRILELDNKTTIRSLDFPPFNTYSVNNIRSFEMKWPRISFKVRMKTDLSNINPFKGSIMNIQIKNNGDVLREENINIVNSNPNNHFHWRGEPEFVDGWYFKCVHIDSVNKATPFFFLYGINNPSGQGNAESFLVCGNGGSISLNTSLIAPEVENYRLSSSKDLIIIRNIPIADFSAEKLYGLNLKIGNEFSATDNDCSGMIIDSGETISWNLKFTKIHPHIFTDFNPFDYFEGIMRYIVSGVVDLDFPGFPLMKHFDKAPFITAYYMSHNMNSFTSGEVEWKGQRYSFNNHKGYQDENWGSKGFPHPYVWLQANNFRDTSGNPLHDTSLVAIFTPRLPMGDFKAYSKIGGICLRYNEKKYQFISLDKSDFNDYLESKEENWRDGILKKVDPRLIEIFPFIDIGVISCTIDFIQEGVIKTVNLGNPEEIENKIGSFPRPPGTFPIKWHLEGTGTNGNDEIIIDLECDKDTVMKLPAPFQGEFRDDVTKQTLHGKVRVWLNSNDEEYTFLSDFGTADYGD